MNRLGGDMDKEEVAKQLKQFLKIEMVKRDMNFVELNKKMAEKGYIYALEALRQRVSRGTYDAKFLFEFADCLDMDVKLIPKEGDQ